MVRYFSHNNIVFPRNLYPVVLPLGIDTFEYGMRLSQYKTPSASTTSDGFQNILQALENEPSPIKQSIPTVSTLDSSSISTTSTPSISYSPSPSESKTESETQTDAMFASLKMLESDAWRVHDAVADHGDRSRCCLHHAILVGHRVQEHILRC